ncbi:copper resistance CopC family protein [Listeria grayi]|uniref:copper resistance CopC family protein n=1 Tax=Listeria grayi TaxID=1641 RepID=UPI00363F29DD
MKLRKAFFICILAIISLGMIIPINASAHAYLQNSNPKDQSHIQKAPKQVRLVFDEMIQADFPSIQVTGSDGKKVSVGENACQQRKRSCGGSWFKVKSKAGRIHSELARCFSRWASCTRTDRF